MKDLRWKRRFNNYKKAFARLADAVTLAEKRELSGLGKQGIIQSFEFTHELAWNVLKDYLEHKGYTNIIGSRDASRTAFKNGLIQDGDAWMKMIMDRNKTSHTYDMNTAEEVVKNIIKAFYPAFKKLLDNFNALYTEEDTD